MSDSKKTFQSDFLCEYCIHDEDYDYCYVNGGCIRDDKFEGIEVIKVNKKDVE